MNIGSFNKLRQIRPSSQSFFCTSETVTFDLSEQKYAFLFRNSLQYISRSISNPSKTTLRIFSAKGGEAPLNSACFGKIIARQGGAGTPNSTKEKFSQKAGILGPENANFSPFWTIFDSFPLGGVLPISARLFLTK